jgi:hypothetical protein
MSLAEVLDEIQELIKQDGKQAKGTMISNIYSYDFADNKNYEEIMKLATEEKPKIPVVLPPEVVKSEQKKVKLQPKVIQKVAQEVVDGPPMSFGPKRLKGLDMRKEKLRV